MNRPDAWISTGIDFEARHMICEEADEKVLKKSQEEGHYQD